MGFFHNTLNPNRKKKDLEERSTTPGQQIMAECVHQITNEKQITFKGIIIKFQTSYNSLRKFQDAINRWNKINITY